MGKSSWSLLVIDAYFLTLTVGTALLSFAIFLHGLLT